MKLSKFPTVLTRNDRCLPQGIFNLPNSEISLTLMYGGQVDQWTHDLRGRSHILGPVAYLSECIRPGVPMLAVSAALPSRLKYTLLRRLSLSQLIRTQRTMPSLSSTDFSCDYSLAIRAIHTILILIAIL